MQKNISSETGIFHPRGLIALLLFIVAASLLIFGFAAPTPAPSKAQKDLEAPYSGKLLAGTWQRLAAQGLFDTPEGGVAQRAAAGTPASSSKGDAKLLPLVGGAVNATVSPPVRNLPAANQFSLWRERPEEGQLNHRERKSPLKAFERDRVAQTKATIVGMPPVGVSFEGMNISSACGNCLPPDTNGAVGPNHYVQMVNSNFAIYSKAGAVLSPPKAINTLWSATPNAGCATHNNGDPVVLYDQMADRWILSQFLVQASTENYAECIAVSQTPDPTGAYWLYEFDESPDTFHDYPHLGVWPDGYYMSTNLFPNSALLTSTGAGAWVFERPKMIKGQAARYVYFDETPLATQTYTPGGQLPATVDGRYPPVAGAPNFFAEVNDTNQPDNPGPGVHDEMHLWKFHVDWNNPANSTFGTGSTPPAPKPGFSGQFAGNAGQPNFVIPVANFVLSACQIQNGPNDCTPEKLNPPQPAQYLDVLGDRLMFRLVYRNFGNHESLVLNHTVDALVDQPMGVARNGVRWYEVRNLSTTPTVFQQGTFAPLQDPTDPLWRWMGSAAMDNGGNLAIGYSASGPNHFPSLHYAGRLTSDPLNVLTQGEAVMFLGQGIEANTGIFPFRNRWGDYSNLTVDPVDDCTFWYTNEYLAPNAPTDILPVDWHTRVGTFKFSQCVSAVLVPVSAVSRKTHDLAGVFDIDLPLIGTPGIECRTGGTSGEHQVVVTFVVPVTVTSASVTSGVGSVSGTTISGNQVFVNLTGVANAQKIAITLFGVSDGSTTGNVVIPMGVLLGDTNASGATNSTDIGQTKANSGKTADASNFRTDVTVNGLINSSDVATVKASSGTALPP